MNNIFLAALAFLALERIGEMVYARQQATRLVALGARFVRDDGMGLIVAVHAGLFLAAAFEWFTAPWAHISGTSIIGVGVFVVGDALRFWAIVTLGHRWNTRVYVLDAPLVTRGPFRLMRHPNYVGVTLVIIGFPLAFHLYGTALGLSVLNAIALHRRIGKEEFALGIRGHGTAR